MIAQGPLTHEDPEERDVGMRPHVRGILPQGEHA
jgi:hypothetical protein